jgi:predicted SAM-dependent methyltransferase
MKIKRDTNTVDPAITRGISLRMSHHDWLEEEAERQGHFNKSRIVQEALESYRSQRENGHGREVRVRREEPDMDGRIQRDPLYYDIGKLS